MGLLLATVTALVLWIVLWAVGFGRTGDAFIVTVPPIVLIAATVHALRRRSGQPADTEPGVR